MLGDGIYGSVLFPTLPRFAGTLFPTFKDLELAEGAFQLQACNDFIIREWCPGGPPGMFVPTIISQLWDPTRAAAEIRRCAGLGARALSFPENPVPLGMPSRIGPTTGTRCGRRAGSRSRPVSAYRH